jgi:hypothetical protein
MKQLLDEMVARPLGALRSVVEMFGQRVEVGQRIDGILSRFAHTLSGPSLLGAAGQSEVTSQSANFNSMTDETNSNGRSSQVNNAGLTDQDHLILDRVDGALADGQALKRWWDQKYPDGFEEKFDLERAFNRPADSFGFFDQVELATGVLPVMGNFQNMFYDQPRTPANLNRQAAGWMRDQIREFVLHYFMRVSAFRQPEVYVQSGQPALPGYLQPLSWCPRPDVLRQGFGFKQCYYKLRNSGEIGKFSEQEETAIVDLREIGSRYEWIVVKVRIFDFSFGFKPFGSNGPELSVPLTEESYLVLGRDFILDEDNPSPDSLGRYGLGYAFIRDPAEGLIGYGPGQFRAAIEIINFEISKRGDIHVSMIFVADRPERIANVSLNPVDWSFRLADFFSLGTSSKFLAPVKSTLEKIPTSVDSFDPVYGFVSLANTLTANQAAQQLCISRRQLEKDFLAQHFIQHYVTIVGSLLTWRQISDWLDGSALPEWVVTGRSS